MQYPFTYLVIDQLAAIANSETNERSDCRSEDDSG
jgi:hypothetical protein